MAELEPHELEAVESLVALEERRAAIAADPSRVMHACTLGWPEIPSDAMDNLCGRLGLFAKELTEDLDKVSCPDCLRAIAEWGQLQGQAACGLAMRLGSFQQLVETMQLGLSAIARAAKNLALATPDQRLRSELQRAVRLAEGICGSVEEAPGA